MKPNIQSPPSPKNAGWLFLNAPQPKGHPRLRNPPQKIQKQVAKSVHEHLIIYTDAEKTTQIWQWVKHEAWANPTP